jgi:aspartate/methionine/tyrosine aminotransferase
VRRALDGVVSALRSFPGRAIDLLAGEPCFEAPAALRAAFARAAREPASGYGPVAGLPELRRLLAEREDGGRAGAENVVVTHGAKGGLLVLLAALVEPGDEVIHPVPCYPAYPAMVRRFGGVPVAVPERGDGFAGWSEAVATRVGRRTRAVLLSSPSNPSGSVLDEDRLAALVELCRAASLRLVVDQAYAAFSFEGAGAAVRLGEPEAAVVRVGSASKSFAVCGWRIGWVVADPNLVSRIIEVQGALLNPPATPPQRALLALPEVPEEGLAAIRLAVRERQQVMVETLRGIGFDATLPAGGFYLWIDLRSRLGDGEGDTVAWCERIAAECGVGLWPGEDFGGPGFVRLALPLGDRWREDVTELGRRLSVWS